MNLKERARQLKTDIPAVFIALGRREMPVAAKIMAGLTVVYALSPVDLIPDFIPVLGYLDDLVILPGLVTLTVKLIPTELMAECRIQSAGMWKEGKPEKWYYALPIVLVWALVIGIIVKAIWF